MKPLLAAALAVAALLLAAWLAWPEADEAPALASSAEVSTLPEPEALPEARRPGSREPETPAPTAISRDEVRVRPRPAESEEPDAAPLPLREIFGQVVLIEESGELTSGLDCRLGCVLWRGREQKRLNLDAVDGVFSFEVADWSELEVRCVILAGERYACPVTPRERHDLSAANLLVHIERTPTLELSVIDAISGEHLEGIELVSQSSGMLGHRSLLPEHSSMPRPVGDGRSPLTIEASYSEAVSGESARLLVHSPGHAWTPVELRFRDSGEQVVRLEAGGELLVEVQGELPGEPAHLRLVEREPGAAAAAQVRLGPAREHRFEDVPPGSYWVRLVELERGWRLRATLAEVPVEILPGGRQVVRITPGPPVAAPAQVEIRAPRRGE